MRSNDKISMSEEDKKPKATLIRHQKNQNEAPKEELSERKDVSNPRVGEKKK